MREPWLRYWSAGRASTCRAETRERLEEAKSACRFVELGACAIPKPVAGGATEGHVTAVELRAGTPLTARVAPGNPLSVSDSRGNPVLHLLRIGEPPLELAGLRPGEYAALDALRRAFPEQLERDRFADLAGVADPSRELSRATDRYPVLENALIRPVKSSKRRAGKYGLAPLQAA